MTYRRALAALWGLFVLAGCEQTPLPLVVWGDHPDAAYVVERYAAETEVDARFQFRDNITEALTQERVVADVVIGRWVHNPTASPVVLPFIAFPDVPGLALGDDGAPGDAWIPISYQLPAVVFVSARLPVPPFPTVDRTTLATVLAERRAAIGGSAYLPGIMPTADAAAAYRLVRAEGAAFTADRSGRPAWDAGSVTRAAAGASQWLVDINGSEEEQAEYIARYLYEPWYRQLETGRVEAVLLASGEALDWTFFGDDTFDVRWLARPDGSIAVLENVVYAGIPDATDNARGAAEFIAWLQQPATQVALVGGKLEQRLDSFGLFGGFSVNDDANRQILAAYYPRLVGRVPQGDALRFPGIIPRYWDEARAAVVEPALRDALATGSVVDEGDLMRRLDRWYNQRGD